MVKSPVDMIALGDCVLGGVYESTGAGAPITDVGGTDRFSFGEWLSIDPRVRPVAMARDWQRHAAKYNVAFCDAHIENLKISQLFANSPIIRKRWNNDNEPH